MAQVTLGGNPVNTVGELPAVGSAAPSYTLAGADLSDITPDSFSGKKVVLNIFPSIDTPTSATSVRTFNKAVADRDDAVVLCVSQDLPFAQARFCGSEGLSNVVTASAFRSDSATTSASHSPTASSPVCSPGRSSSSTSPATSSTPSSSPRSPKNPTTTPPSPPSVAHARAAASPFAALEDVRLQTTGARSSRPVVQAADRSTPTSGRRPRGRTRGHAVVVGPASLFRP